MENQEQSTDGAPDLSQSGYVTRELAMAAFLSLNGYMFDLRKEGTSNKGHPIGAWNFKDRDGDLGKVVQQFNKGEAQVEPDRYLKEVNNVRKAMFIFLDIPKR